MQIIPVDRDERGVATDNNDEIDDNDGVDDDVDDMSLHLEQLEDDTRELSCGDGDDDSNE